VKPAHNTTKNFAPECHEASKHNLLKFGFLLLVRFNHGFTIEGRLATVLIIPSSWGSQQDVLTSHHRGQTPTPSPSRPIQPPSLLHSGDMQRDASGDATAATMVPAVPGCVWRRFGGALVHWWRGDDSMKDV
jgi:hypothetical protein